MTETTLLPLSLESQEIVYRDRNQSIQRVVARFDGFEKEYFVSDHGLRAAVMVVRNDEILLVRQYRLLINGLSYEIPGGRIDENETPEQAAIRECLEETGVVCSDLKLLIDYLPSLDIWKNHTYVFYTEKIENEEKEKSDRHEWIPLENCVSMIFGGQITDSLSIIAILACRTMRG